MSGIFARSAARHGRAAGGGEAGSRSGRPNSGRRRLATAAAVSCMVAFPVIGLALAPEAQADSSSGPSGPGSNLAGLNASSSSSGVQIEPLTPGVVGAGNVSQGNLFEIAVPYAGAGSTTGPSNTAVSSPVYPGPTAANAGNALGTFAPQFPPAFLNLLNYPALAQADYPPERTVGTSGYYSPPAGSQTGAGDASAKAGDSGAESSSSSTSNQLPGGLSVASSTADASTSVLASSLEATGHSVVGTITLLGGQIVIDGLSSKATASSNGNQGSATSDLQIGAVTVAGQKASIGPNGITLPSGSQGSSLFPSANQVLIALQQAGISVHTVAPVTTYDGSSASVTSGGVQILFMDQHIPNPNGQVPLSSVGLEYDIGFSQATADATALPPFQPFGSGSGFGAGAPAAGAPASPMTGAAPAGPATSGVVPTGGASSRAIPAPSVLAPGSPATAQPKGGATGSPPADLGPVTPASALGMPVRVAWVIIAFLLSLVAAGPLLAYANWQLLRGRSA